MEKANRHRSAGMLVAAMLIFGTIGIFRRHIPMSSAVLAFSRGILGGTFLLIFTRIMRGRGKTSLAARDFFYLAFIGAVMGINWILLFEAYNHTSVAVATLCYYMQPTIVMLLSPLIFKEPLTGKKVACAAVAVVGMFLVSGVTNQAAHGDVKGILLGLGAAVFYAGVVILNKKKGGIDAYEKTSVELLSAGAVMVPYLLLTGDVAGGDFGVSALVLLFVVGIVHTGIAYVLYFGSMDGLPVQSVAILSYIDPVSALLFSAVFLGEWLSVSGMVGAVMIIGSAIVSER